MYIKALASRDNIIYEKNVYVCLYIIKVLKFAVVFTKIINLEVSASFSHENRINFCMRIVRAKNDFYYISCFILSRFKVKIPFL